MRPADKQLAIGTAVLALLGTTPHPGNAQGGPVLDEGAFTIVEGTTVIGREEFTVRRGRSGAPSEGFTITATAGYPPTQPTRTVTVRLELGADSQPVAAEIQERSQQRRAIVMRFAPRRITVRLVSAAGESVREHPKRARTLLHVEAVFAVFAILPSPGSPLAAITDEGDRPVDVSLTDHGLERVRVKGIERALHHYSLGLGSDEHHVWFDEQGRLIQVSIPARNVKAVREAS